MGNIRNQCGERCSLALGSDTYILSVLSNTDVPRRSATAYKAICMNQADWFYTSYSKNSLLEYNHPPTHPTELKAAWNLELKRVIEGVL